MNEFVEIGSSIYRRDLIEEVHVLVAGGVSVVLASGCEVLPNESYESIRGKLMGAPVTNDRREELVRHLVAIFRNDKLHDVADRIEGYYHSAMLSEMEGAG